MLAVDLSLLYLLGDPEDTEAVWKKLFQKKTWANKLSLRMKLFFIMKLSKCRSLTKYIKEMTEIFNELVVVAVQSEDKVVYLLTGRHVDRYCTCGKVKE